MRIILINLNTKGGMVQYISQLANALVKYNEVYVIAQKGIETDLFNNRVNLIQMDTGNTKRNFVINTILVNRLLKFLNVIHTINPDIIHLQDYHPWICLFFPFLKKYTIVTTIHDVVTHPGTRSIDKDISRKIHLKYSDAVIVHGQKAKEILITKSKNKKIFIIPHGDYSFFTELDQWECDEEPFTILFFGRIEAYKGLKYLIQAVPLIADKIPKIKVIIAGSGDFIEKSEIERSRFFEIHNYFIENQKVGYFFKRASVVVLPYVEGTQTGVVPIAYSFKKPVIVTDVGSIPEVVDEGVTGYIVPPKDKTSLANAIIELLINEELRKEMGENAYRKMSKELSWDLIAEKTVQVYINILESKK